MKAELSKPTTLMLLNPEAPMKVSADAPSFAFGAVLLQVKSKLVVDASCSMNKTEWWSAGMSKLKKQLLPSLGHVKSSHITSWEKLSSSRPTTSL